MEERKRKKYVPRGGAVECPGCEKTLRTVFVTRDEGGWIRIPWYAGCPICQKVYQISVSKPLEIVR